MRISFLGHWRGDFLTGLAVLLPTVVTLAVIKWFFGTVSGLTDLLLFFLPQTLTHRDHGNGPMAWYWSLAAFLFAIELVSVVGLLARYYVGKRLITWLDAAMLGVPLLNKIYGTIKQVNDAFSTGSKTSFKTVVRIEFPREGIYSLGFLTREKQDPVPGKANEKLLCVFVPTTPNPTSGFLVLLPEEKVTRLSMSVADGIKYIISLGAITPEPAPPDP